MTFDHLPGAPSTRARMPSPYDVTIDSADATPTNSSVSKMNKATAFFTHLWGKKSSSVGKTNQPMAATTEAPRPSRSMPPSPFSSLKRPTKASKKRRSTTMIGGQSMSPVSPEADVGQPSFYHQRSQSMRSGSRNSVHSLQSLQSPLTPPSPTVDFGRTQFSPPTAKPGGSQPISIGFQRSGAALTPRGSPVVGLHNLNLKPAPDDYVLPVQPAARFSASPSRLITMPTLSPLPEVNARAHPFDTPAKTPVNDYVNVDFKSDMRANQNQFRFDEPLPALNRTEPSAPIPIKAANENKENDAVVPPIEAKFIELSAVPAVSTPTPVPAKQRANSLEKIVAAILDVKPGPKRHSSGDKPHKRSSGVSIFRYEVSATSLIR